MVQKELKRLYDNPNFTTLYGTALDALKQSGALEVMRLLGQPHLVFDGKDQSALAAQAARSVGWNAALNTLLNLELLIDAAVEPKGNPKLRYGGLDLAVQRGDLLKEEKDAIEHGRTPDPSIYKPKSGS